MIIVLTITITTTTAEPITLPLAHVCGVISSAEKQASKRQVLKDTKNTIQESIDETAHLLVLGNRISWNSYEFENLRD